MKSESCRKTPIIAHLITGLGHGGAQAMLAKLLDQTSDGRFHHCVISLMASDKYTELLGSLGIVVHSLEVRQGAVQPFFLPRMVRLLRQIEPAVLQGWMYHGNFAASICRLACPSVPVTWNVRHSLDAIEKEKRLTRWILRGSRAFASMTKAIIYNSKRSAEQHEAFGFPSEKRVFIPNGFDLDSFKPSSDAYFRFRQQNGIEREKPVLGMVARYHPMKNHLGMLDAMKSGRVAKHDPYLVFVGIGATDDNQELMEAIAKRGLERRVRLLGARDDVPDVVAALDVLVVPSLWGEGFANVIGEALAAGVTCVATDVGESKSIIGSCGRIIKPGIQIELNAAIDDILSMSPDRRRELGIAGRERVNSLYSLESVAGTYQKLYSEIIEKRQR